MQKCKNPYKNMHIFPPDFSGVLQHPQHTYFPRVCIKIRCSQIPMYWIKKYKWTEGFLTNADGVHIAQMALHEIILDKRVRLFLFVKQQPSIYDHVTRIRPSIFIGKEHQAHQLHFYHPVKFIITYLIFISSYSVTCTSTVKYLSCQF